MSDPRFDVVGIGNAIVDILGRCDDAFLEANGAAKGHMQLVEAGTIETLYGGLQARGGDPIVEISGGSAANTMVGVAGFGGRAAFIGKVGRDKFGDLFTRDIRAANVAYDTPPSNTDTPTARSLVLVTPDGQRTMNTFLGVSPELAIAEIDPDLIAASAIIYLEGYLFDRDEAKAAFRQAAKLAKDAGRKVALTLSDGFCVDRHREEFLELIKTDVDILFANHDEITSLYSTSSFDEAAAQAARDTHLAILTRSEKGSMIVGDGKHVAIDAFPVDTVVDTTGAGDLYAAGLLYGISRGLDLETSGKLGSMAASEIISHIGARPEASLSTMATNHGLSI